MIFTPILKTKTTSEYKALIESDALIKQNANIIPYIECIKKYDDRCVEKYINLFGDKSFFLEPLQHDMETILDKIDIVRPNEILVFRVDRLTTLDELKNFINANRSAQRRFGIKINDADNRFLSVFKELGVDAFLFVELGGTAYTASSFLEDIMDEDLKCLIIIHSNEREQYLRGEDFNDFSYNDKDNFNFSIIDSIKSGTFLFNGFGSRCSTKDDNTEDVKRAKAVFGVFLIYSYRENNFFSIKSNDKKHISKVYYDVRDKVMSKLSLLNSTFFDDTKISKKVLKDYLDAQKISCSKFITVSIIRYIEEIASNLF